MTDSDSAGIKPSQEQSEILNTAGSTMVIANPGTGKTTTLAFKVVRLLEQGTDPRQILCITFTRKARREMYEKITKYGAGRFADKIGKINIHTFHSFAYGYLEDRGAVTGEMADDNVLRFSVFNSIMENEALIYAKPYIISNFVPKISSAIKYIKSFGITPDLINTPNTREALERAYTRAKEEGKSTVHTLEETKAFLKYFADAYSTYENTKADASDYTDILIRFLKDAPSTPLYDHALIDEMQDMNEIQANIASGLAKTTFLVGDPKQAIFGFQGGSTRHLKSFESVCTTRHLTENRRSTNRILDYAKKHYMQNTSSSTDGLDRLRSNLGAGNKPVVISASEDPLAVILQITRENQGKQIGILARTNGQVLSISEMLEKNDITHTSATAMITTDTAKMHIIDFLSGVLYDNPEYKIKAMFTAFSPYTLREAFEISQQYSDKTRGFGDSNPSFEKLDALGGDTMTLLGMQRLFESVIFPICISQGAEWYYTARAVKQEIDRYISSAMPPTATGLFDYLRVCEEPGVEQHDTPDASGTVTLSTVHKAKGREFEMVIYWPKDTDRFDFMDIIKAAILESCKIDVSGELEEEQSRLHFVALTRARRDMYIIIGDESAERGFEMDEDSAVCIKGESMLEEQTAKAAAAPAAATKTDRLEKAYALFVNNKTAEAKSLLESKDGEGWIENVIYDYFANMEKLSYSVMHKKASEFLQYEIITIPRSNNSAKFGSDVHDAMQDILQEGGLEGMQNAAQKYYDISERSHTQKRQTRGSSSSPGLPSIADTIRNSCAAISEISQKYEGARVYGTEKKIKVPLNAMTDHEGAGGLEFVGKIDVILEHDSGYVIIDYKTDKDKGRLSEHNMQLAAYKRMLACDKGIPEESIETYVVFVSIRGRINTGRLDYEHVKSKRDAYGRFEKMLTGVLEWRQDTAGFIKKVIEEGPQFGEDVLFGTIRKELESHIGADIR